MKFVKLHHDGQALLVNLNNVSDIFQESNNKSRLFLNVVSDGHQVSIPVVDESIDEILELIKQVGE